MSRYPDNCPSPQSVTIHLTCGDCGHTWTAPGTCDLGQCDLRSEYDGICPECESPNSEAEAEA